MSTTPLLVAQALSKTFGVKPLFEDISISVGAGEKVALIGPNGSGKSTLLKILAGLETPDGGRVISNAGLFAVYVSQEDRFDETLTVTQVLENTLTETGIPKEETAGRINRIVGRVGFPDPDESVKSLSGGWRKRLSLARALILEPELLLLDEPTNHLDIRGVLWLEELLRDLRSAVIFISHDRYFIERLSQRVFEINRKYPKGYFSADGAYSEFLERREMYLETLHQEQKSLANKVRREVEWLRQGAKARTTKSKSRIDQAEGMIEKLASYDLKDKRVSMGFAASDRRTKELVKVDNVTHELGGKVLFKDISLILSPGFRLGIAGANGSGKSTFMKALVGEIEPDSGTITRATNLRFAFFDQARRQLDPKQTLRDALCPDGDFVIFNKRPIHVAGWADRFLFRGEQLALPVERLSGGEQARLLLARMMAQDVDILLFDEPTNDLDIPTLEVLEDSFQEFPGAIVLVTHDRYLLDRTVSSILGITENAGTVFAGYQQWEASEREALKAQSSGQRSTRVVGAFVTPSEEKLKLTQSELKELNGMEKKISKAEALVEDCQTRLADPAVGTDADLLTRLCDDLAAAQQSVEECYARWQELEARR